MTSSKLDEIRDRLLEFSGLMVFRYHGVEFDIDPFSDKDFHINYSGNEFDVHSVEEVFSTSFLDGECMKNVAHEIEVVDWG